MMLPVERNSFAERINPKPPAADSLSATDMVSAMRDCWHNSPMHIGSAKA